MSFEEFKAHLNGREGELFSSFHTPADIQAYLDGIPYSTQDSNRSPLSVLHDGVAHCLDGALFAATALDGLGFTPQIIDLFPEPGTDDDHVLAIFRRGSCVGAIAKSNYAGLRFREAIYRSFRELVLSYFESFYNIFGQKTLRSYTMPLDLRRYDAQGWMWQDETAYRIEKRLYGLPRKNLFPLEIARYFAPVDQRSFEAGRLGTDPDGLYNPRVP